MWLPMEWLASPTASRDHRASSFAWRWWGVGNPWLCGPGVAKSFCFGFRVGIWLGLTLSSVGRSENATDVWDSATGLTALRSENATASGRLTRRVNEVSWLSARSISAARRMALSVGLISSHPLSLSEG